MPCRLSSLTRLSKTSSHFQRTLLRLSTTHDNMIENGELSVVVTTVAAICTTVLIISLFVKRNGAKDSGRRFPPTLPVLTLLGAVIRGGISVLPEYFMKTAEKLGPVFSFSIGGRLVVILNSKEIISDAFLKQSEAFADRYEFWMEKNFLNQNLRGIIFSRYNEVFKMKHKLCLTILKDFGFGVNSVSETRILQEVESFHEEILKHRGQSFNSQLLTGRSTFNVVSSILFGRTFASSDTCHKIAGSVHEYAKQFDIALNIAPFLRFLPNFRKKISSLKQIHRDILKNIREGIECSRSKECESTFVSRFMEIQGTDYDNQELLYIIRDLCIASADTVSTTLQWALVELANHPEVQTRFQEEIDNLVPTDRLPSLDDKPRLPYTGAVILEIMRRRTLVPTYGPHVTLKEAEVLGYYIPKGCIILANAFSAHMDPKFWKDPEVFRPERFLDEDGNVVGSENVIPFGLGKRSCLREILGRQEIFLFLTSLVQRFDIRPPEGQNSISVDEIVGAVVHPSDFEVRLIPRRKIMN